MNIVEIKGHKYRYRYDTDSGKTIYVGPVGDSPSISEQEFLAALPSHREEMTSRLKWDISPYGIVSEITNEQARTLFRQFNWKDQQHGGKFTGVELVGSQKKLLLDIEFIALHKDIPTNIHLFRDDVKRPWNLFWIEEFKFEQDPGGDFAYFYTKQDVDNLAHGEDAQPTPMVLEDYPGRSKWA